MIAIQKGTTSWRSTNTLAADEVQFSGTFLYESDGVTPAMVWDDALQNVRAMTQADRDARSAAIVLALHARAKALLSADDAVSKEIKGFVLVVLDEINILRAALGLPARTITQLKNAIAAKIDAGNADG